MSDIVYLTIAGEQQGAISDSCGTADSIGNRRQIGHENEIFVFRSRIVLPVPVMVHNSMG